jgi:membrane protein DedA with SNARE-associated domain
VNLFLEQQILQFITNIYQSIQWPGVVLMMAIESACIPLPSEIIMPLAGWLLIKDMGLPASYLWLAGLYGAIGNVIGSLVAYEVGRWGGRPFLNRWGKYILILRSDLDRADNWFNRYGSWSIFVSRLLPAVRTFISLPAGIAKMNLVKFTIYSFIGSFIWSLALAYAGYQIGAHWEQIRTVMRPFDYVIIGIVLALIGYYIYRHVRRYNREKAGK